MAASPLPFKIASPTKTPTTSTMVQSEVDVLHSAKAILEQKQYQKLRNFIWVSHNNEETGRRKKERKRWADPTR